MSRQTFLLSLVLCSITLLFPGSPGFGKDVTITKQEAIEIANKELLRKGEDLNSLKVDVNTHWDRQLDSNPHTLDHFPEVATQLKGRTFWAISYLTTRPHRRGGGYTIFVDKETGEILGLISWE